MKLSSLLIVLIFIFTACREKDDMKHIYKIIEDISITSNITYKTVDSLELQLDVYYPAKKLGEDPWDEISNQKKPTLIYFHGGGWVSGDRTSRFLGLLPYLEKGWCVVNVDYRLLQETNLIGSLNDCIDAINWVTDNASTYKFDTNNLYLSGESAGGHLALLAGMVNNSEGSNEIHKREGEVRGIINWYGITEMESAIEFWDDADYEQLILAKSTEEREQYLELTSPISYVSTKNTPPIFSVHGNEDINVQIEQAISFHGELQKHGIKNKLLEIDGKKHGNFNTTELEMIYKAIWEFFEIDH